jgi:hypothetical protein
LLAADQRVAGGSRSNRNSAAAFAGRFLVPRRLQRGLLVEMVEAEKDARAVRFDQVGEGFPRAQGAFQLDHETGTSRDAVSTKSIFRPIHAVARDTANMEMKSGKSAE